MINKNFYIKDHIHPKHLNNKIGKKLNLKIPANYKKLCITQKIQKFTLSIKFQI